MRKVSSLFLTILLITVASSQTNTYQQLIGANRDIKQQHHYIWL